MKKDIKRKEALGSGVDMEYIHGCKIIPRQSSKKKNTCKVYIYKQSIRRNKIMQNLGLLPMSHKNIII